MSVETGQLRCWTTGHKLTPFLIIEYDALGAGAWWILTPTGRDWEPNDEIEEHSEAIDETG
jgi:hypothetical protein